MKSYQDVQGDGGSGIADQVARQNQRLRRRLNGIDRTLAVMSGKGGVGKSSVAVQLATAFALEGHRVGLVDADVNGPSVARMVGLQDADPEDGETGVRPPKTAEGVHIMGMDLFLPDEDTPVLWDAPTQKDAFTWREAMETAAVREFVADTEWGRLDLLLFDLPPGSRRLPHLADLLPNLSGAIVITLPSEISRSVVGRSVRMAEELLAAPLLGLVENMSTYECPHCGSREDLFPEAEEGVPAWAARRDLAHLGAIPFDPRLARATEAGRSFLTDHPDAPAAHALHTLADRISARIDPPLRPPSS